MSVSRRAVLASGICGAVLVAATARGSYAQMPGRTVYLEDETQVIGDGAASDTEALQAVLNTVGAAGGGHVVGKRGAIYRLPINMSTPNKGIAIPAGVHLDPGCATFNFECTGQWVYGFRLLSKARLWGEGLIQTTSSTGDSGQRLDHAPIALGSCYGDDGPLNTANPFVEASGWRVGGGLRVRTVKPDGGTIHGHGGFRDWLIEDVELPDSAAAGIGIGFDWLPRGLTAFADFNAFPTMTNQQVAALMTKLQAAYAQGAYYTLHPGDGAINRVVAGALTYSGAATGNGGTILVRLSGCLNVTVSRVHAKRAASAVFITSGDVGGEFAPQSVRSRLGRGLRVEDFVLEQADGSTYGAFYADQFADNMEHMKSYGFAPQVRPIDRTDLEFVRCATHGGSSPQAAYQLRYMIGGKLTNCSSRKHLRGVHVGDGADCVEVIGGEHSHTKWEGVLIDGEDKPEGARVRDVRVWLAGFDNPGSNVGAISMYRSLRPAIDSCIIGRGDDDESAIWGIRASEQTAGADIIRNSILRTRPGSGAISVGSSESTGIARRIADNYIAPGLAPYSGCAAGVAAKGWGG